jgi:hypothetical protein
MGRWVSHTYQGRGTTKLTIFSADQVVAKEITTPGSTITAAQQYSLLLQQQDGVLNPCTAFQEHDPTLAIQTVQAWITAYSFLVATSMKYLVQTQRV